MPWLYVTVHLHGALVEEKLCPVAEALWLGDVPEAAVTFPGARVRVRRVGDRLEVEGRRLDVGRRLKLRKGPVDVRLEAVRPRPMPMSLEGLPDLRILVASAAVVLFGAWLETSWRFVSSNPVAQASAHALFQAAAPEEPVATARPNLPAFHVDDAFELPPRPVEQREDWPPAVFRP